MSKNHTYILGINAYDHDVSACLLRDGEIAFAIAKERITREKHASGFYKEVVDYCLDAEGISLDDVDLVVRNCYVLPVEEMETAPAVPGHAGISWTKRSGRRQQSIRSICPRSNKVVTVSHHLAHAYSAFAACPFERGS